MQSVEQEVGEQGSESERAFKALFHISPKPNTLLQASVISELAKLSGTGGEDE